MALTLSIKYDWKKVFFENFLTNQIFFINFTFFTTSLKFYQAPSCTSKNQIKTREFREGGLFFSSTTAYVQGYIFVDRITIKERLGYFAYGCVSLEGLFFPRLISSANQTRSGCWHDHTVYFVVKSMDPWSHPPQHEFFCLWL